MSDSEVSSQLGHFCLGIVTTLFMSIVILQPISATEIDLNTIDEKEKNSVELIKSYQTINSSNIEDRLKLQNFSHKAELIQLVSRNNDSISLKTNPWTSNISYAAADLQLKDEFTLVEQTMEEQLLAREVDIDTFCQNYPFNSRCANYQPPAQRRKQEQPVAQPTVERQFSGYAVTGRVSTLGFGIEGTGAISPNFNGRLGLNYFEFGIDTEQSDIEYDADVQLLSVSALVDWFPSERSEFRVTAGLAYNNNKVDAIARPATNLEIGGIDFPTELIGQLEGELTFPNTISPYIGIGYGNPVNRDRRFGFSVDLGVLFTGSPNVDLNATGPVAGALIGAPVVGPLLNQAIQEEEDDLEDDLSGLSVYPVLSVGLSYQF